MRCLEKDRSRRYSSAQELADDLMRHLQGEAVQAGPPTPLYRLRKWIRRRQTALAVGLGSIVVIASLVDALQMRFAEPDLRPSSFADPRQPMINTRWV